MTTAEDICVHARIHGRVQGVFYRAWTQRTAQALGLAGWVRNRRDGTVEALFRGSRQAVEEMLRRAEEGPPAARVERIDAREVPCDTADTPSGFEVRPTA